MTPRNIVLALRYCAHGCALLVLAGSAAARAGAEVRIDSVAMRNHTRPKTLFAWTLAAEEPDDGEEEPDRIVTDRPHFSEASSLVGLGVVQIETGYTLFRDTNAGVTTFTQSFPEPLLRAGVFAEWFEFRIAYNYLVERTSGAVPQSQTLSGSDDMYIGAKLALTEQAGCLPEIALFPQARLPTGAQAFTSREPLPGFNLAYSWMLNDWIELECNTQLNRRRDDADHFYTEFIQTANVEYDLLERLGAFTEWFCFVPSGALVAQTQHYFHAGFVYFPTNNMQLDIHAGLGLNRPADDMAYTGCGYSMRF